MSTESPTRPRPETARVFFALWPPTDIARQLAGVAAEVSKQAGGRQTCRETIHLTLVFLGDIAVERLPELQRVAGEIHASAFDLTLYRFGLWPHNRLFWAGCDSPPSLIGFVSALKTRLLDAGFTVADANRPFTPHVTLVRKVARLNTPLPVTEPQTWPCKDFVLVRSRLSAEGSAYGVVARFLLVE